MKVRNGFVSNSSSSSFIVSDLAMAKDHVKFACCECEDDRTTVYFETCWEKLDRDKVEISRVDAIKYLEDSRIAEDYVVACYPDLWNDYCCGDIDDEFNSLVEERNKVIARHKVDRLFGDKLFRLEYGDDTREGCFYEHQLLPALIDGDAYGIRVSNH